MTHAHRHEIVTKSSTISLRVAGPLDKDKSDLKHGWAQLVSVDLDELCGTLRFSLLLP